MNSGIVCPTPTLGTTVAMTVRSTDRKAISLHPISHSRDQLLLSKRVSTSAASTQ